MPVSPSISPLEQLDIGQWAWEFLRRNPAYQADYREFIRVWRALEADYGSPPHRDFPRWKNDPRATCLAWDPNLSTGAACVTEGEDRQLIECWMGSKWGFYQFPQDPALPAWELETPINWRPAPGYHFDKSPACETGAHLNQVQLIFDLSWPLPAQLEAAKQRLIGEQARLRRQGLAVPRTVANQRMHWTALIQALDSGSGALLAEAREMSDRGYREMLRLAPAGN